MIYKTKDFTCPTGQIVLYAKYDSEEKTLVFKEADGYYYPQDNQNFVYTMRANEFMKEHTKEIETIELANLYLLEVGIQEELKDSESYNV